ncbi:MAG TPA: hypothetical protein VHY32_03605 [Caulobacteraceae bacterium]|jgi:hypothetical protein|nr:hypothetical protein [Caulobacteraceae bacterium]
MTLAQIVNWIALALTCAIVFWRGRRPERFGMVIIIAGFLATPLVQRVDSWYAPQYGILAVDAAALLAFIWLAFRYGCYWAICGAAFQTVSVFIHFAFMIAPHALYRAYYFGNFSIGYLVLGSILGGVIFERATPVRCRPLPWPRPSSASGSSED